MFSSAEFLEEWNQIFSYKIKETDLAKPTENFVFNTLINYLKMFNFDTSPMIQLKNCENVTERRAFLVRFCNYIDHIYKISDKSHCFFIYDLKHPSPKKTIHMLNHLLNYWFYYVMFKESIVPLANDKILQRQKLIDEIKKIKIDRELIAIKAKNIEKHIKDLRSLAPQTIAKLSEIIEAESSQKDAINYLEDQLKECKSVLESLREDEVRLSMEVVSKEEVDRLKSTNTSLDDAIDEQLNIKRTTFKNYEERSVTINNLQSILSSIDKAMALNPPSFLKSHKDCVNKYNELESKFTEISQRKQDLQTTNETLIEDLEKLEKDCTSKNNLLTNMKIDGAKQIEEKKRLAEANEASLCDLEHEYHNTETQLAEEKEVTEYILEQTTLLVRATMNTSVGS